MTPGQVVAAARRGSDWVGELWGRFRSDLSADPYLKFVLGGAFLVFAFGVWFRLPNFAGPDEYSRLIDPMTAVGVTAADPSFASLQAGVLDGRALGATFYLYALVLAPVFVVVVLSGQLPRFVELGSLDSRWTLWHAAPDWFWTLSVLLGRLVTVVAGVACVYLTYRLGVRTRDRRAGRLAAVALALSPGFLANAHLVGEDVPMVLFLLATVVLAERYVATGRRNVFLLGCVTGGLAIAFKLSGGAGAITLGVAHLVWARRQERPLRALARPGVVLGGLLVGAATVYVAMPSVLVGGPGELLARATTSISSKTARTGNLEAPIWYWMARQSVQAVGLPIAVAVGLGVLVGAGRAIADRRRPSSTVVLLAATVAVFLAVYLRWSFVRTRHLVPLAPFAFAFVGAEASRWYDHERGRRVVRVGLAVVLVTSLPLVAGAEAGYVTEPRDEATRWLATNTGENATVEVYENSVADVAAVHGRELSRYDFPEEEATNRSSLVSDDAAFTAWMLNATERRPDYIQLTGAELDYLDPTTTDYRQYPRRRAYVRGLLNGTYDYTVAAEFGQPRGVETLRDDFWTAVVSPEIDGQEAYVVILEREG